MTDQPDQPITVTRETLIEIAKAAYTKGKEDGSGVTPISEARVTYPETPTEVEALLDRAFAPLRAELEGAVINLDEPQP